MHAEPWDKLVTVASGRAYGAWVDLRAGDDLRHDVRRRRSSPAWRCSCPRGVGNGYQTLADATAYSYLVNDHWRPDVAVRRRRPRRPGARRSTGRSRRPSACSRTATAPAPALADVTPGAGPRRPLVLGADGQVGPGPARGVPGRARRHPGRARPDRRRRRSSAGRGASTTWCSTPRRTPRSTRAETPEGRRAAWAVNADRSGHAWPALAGRHGFTLVHFSTDYVYDGTRRRARRGRAARAARGATARARPRATSRWPRAPRHYVVRTSWVIGDGRQLRAHDGPAGRRRRVAPSVVADQVGRLGFADEIARATRHLLDRRRAVRHLPRQQRRAAHVVGRRRARGLRAARPRAPTTYAR